DTYKEYALSTFNSKIEHIQNFALYSIAGNFNIVYIFDSVTKNKKKSHDNIDSIIYFTPKNIKAFIVDSVDFNNEIDNNGKEKDQPIGVWDYENIKCDIVESIKQVAKYEYNSFTIPTKLIGEFDNMTKQNNIYPIYNSDFKQSQQFFQMGLDFFIYT
ncbi:DUF6402 family protein, partial [Helicobacter sp. T3_23-1059]